MNQYFPPDVSASAYLLGELAEDLSAKHEVWVVAGRPSYHPDSGRTANGGVNEIRAWSTAFDRASFSGRAVNYGTFMLSSLGQALRVPRPDVVVALTDPPAIGLVGLLAARRHRAPFVYICQDIFPDVGVALGVLRSPTVIRAWSRLNRLLRSQAARIVVIGRDMQRKLEREGVPRDKLALIRNWGVGEPLDEEAARAVREAEGWAGRFVVMHAGNLGLAQNAGAILEAAGILAGREPDLLFVFLGDGAVKRSLQAQAATRRAGNVRFLPYRTKIDAQRLMAAADLHVVSLAPGLWGCVAPSKAFGIMAAGRPFVCAVERESEVALLAEQHGCGIRVDPDDSPALAQAILEVRGQRGEDLGRRGREAFERHYERQIATDAYRELLEELSGMLP